jgi:hypothetical protein
MGIACLAALALVAIANVDRLSHVKAGDYEVHVREARLAVAQAQVSLEQVRSLAGALTRTNLEVLARVGILGAYPDTEKLALKLQLDQELRKLGVPEEQVLLAGRSFDGMMRLRHVVHVKDAVANVVPAEQNTTGSEMVKAFEEMRGARNLDPASPSKVREYVKEKGWQSDDIEAALQDYEYYVEHGRHRRPEVWERPYLGEPRVAKNGRRA